MEQFLVEIGVSSEGIALELPMKRQRCYNNKNVILAHTLNCAGCDDMVCNELKEAILHVIMHMRKADDTFWKVRRENTLNISSIIRVSNQFLHFA